MIWWTYADIWSLKSWKWTLKPQWETISYPQDFQAYTLWDTGSPKGWRAVNTVAPVGGRGSYWSFTCSGTKSHCRSTGALTQQLHLREELRHTSAHACVWQNSSMSTDIWKWQTCPGKKPWAIAAQGNKDKCPQSKVQSKARDRRMIRL